MKPLAVLEYVPKAGRDWLVSLFFGIQLKRLHLLIFSLSSYSLRVLNVSQWLVFFFCIAALPLFLNFLNFFCFRMGVFFFMEFGIRTVHSFGLVANLPFFYPQALY